MAAVGAQRRRMLARSNGRYFWQWPKLTLDSVYYHLAQATADLLTSKDLKHVRECEGQGCGWFFLDVSKNHRRRWCSMESCGNREKARRYYGRHRGKEQSGTGGRGA